MGKNEPLKSDPLLTEDEVAAETRAPSRSTVRHWFATGALKSLKVGRRRLVRRSELERYLRACEGR